MHLPSLFSASFVCPDRKKKKQIPTWAKWCPFICTLNKQISSYLFYFLSFHPKVEALQPWRERDRRIERWCPSALMISLQLCLASAFSPSHSGPISPRGPRHWPFLDPVYDFHSGLSDPSTLPLCGGSTENPEIIGWSLKRERERAKCCPLSWRLSFKRKGWRWRWRREGEKRICLRDGYRGGGWRERLRGQSERWREGKWIIWR